MSNETPLEEHQIQFTSQHRIEFDKLNWKLTKRYQKRDGRGKNANLIDEYGYNEPAYYGGPKAFINRLVDKEFMEGMSNEDVATVHEFKKIVEYALEHIDQVKKEMYEHITEHITVDLGEKEKKAPKKVKGQIISED
jgi:hypothetical protein